MASIEERLQIKREPIDKWSVREQLCLAVARNSDQNLTSVSRALKPFGEPNRPADWFHQKNCAAQYGALLSSVEAPKRKKRTSGVEVAIETPEEVILKRLLSERKAELKRLLAEEKAEYVKLQEDMVVLQSGKVSEEQLDLWCKQIDEEEHQKEQEALAHAQWLREREARKQEIERAWRPLKPVTLIGQKRKNSESIDAILMDIDSMSSSSNASEVGSAVTPPHVPEQQHQQPKQAVSPLLTSLLKSPSQVLSTSSILHSAITSNQRPVATTTSPMIASLLSSSIGVSSSVSPSLQQLVSSAIGHPESVQETPHILDDPNLQILKIDDLANSILIPNNGPLPEMKNDVDVIISDLIENADDIVADPEQHIQIDRNGDLNLNLELDDFDDEVEEESKEASPPQVSTDNSPDLEEATPKEPQQEEVVPIKPPEKDVVVDPFEFREEPDFIEPSKSQQPIFLKQAEPRQVVTVPPVEVEEEEEQEEEDEDDSFNLLESVETPPIPSSVEATNESSCDKEKEVSKEPKDKETTPGSVEIVEVVVMEDEEIKDDLNKSEIEDIVQRSIPGDNDKQETIEAKPEAPEDDCKVEDEAKDEEQIKPEPKDEEKQPVPKIDKDTDVDVEKKEEIKTEKVEEPEAKKEEGEEEEEKEQVEPPKPGLLPAIPEELYDDLTMEVKIDKTGKAKRDYSRTTKKKDDLDVLLAIEKAQQDTELTPEEIFPDHRDYTATDLDSIKKDKDVKSRIKSEMERSSSPWTEEEDVSSNLRSRRRLSTPATPVDSVPNSPVSSIYYYDDDREFRNWKKSVMLVYSRLAASKYASLFLKPITDDQAPGYHSLVRRPMDLSTVRKNIENGTIKTTQEFQRDVLLMVNNAIMYNKTYDTVYEMARQMQQEAHQQIQILLQAQSQVDMPLRRETRTSEPGSKRKRQSETEGGVRGGVSVGGSAKKRKDD